MRVGVDHGMIEPGADIASGKSFKSRHCVLLAAHQSASSFFSQSA
jgi:hypothetical protein